MQTLSCYFLKQEMPEIREVVPTLDEVEILSEIEIPNSDLLQVVMMVTDASLLYTIGLLVQNSRVQKSIKKNFKL